MIIRRERGQERPEKRTVGKREPGTRPRVKKGETTANDQGRKSFGSRPDPREATAGKRVGKTKVIKTSSGYDRIDHLTRNTGIASHNNFQFLSGSPALFCPGKIGCCKFDEVQWTKSFTWFASDSPAYSRD